MPSRPLLAVVTAAALTLGLAACSGDAPDPAETTTGADAETIVDVCATPSGDISDSITVTGDLGTAPTVEFDPGIAPTETERTVVTEGDGAELAAGGSAQVDYAIYNGTSGDLIEAYGYDEGQQPAVFAADVSQLIPGLAKSIGCLTEGTRVVAAIPPSEAFGDTGNEQIGVAADDSIVAVIDIVSVVPQRATGADQPAPEGLPTVTLAEDGEPTVTLPDTEAPTEFQLGLLKKGDGEVVPAGANVTVQYYGVKWSDGESFDSSWGRGPTSFSLTGVVPGFTQAIEGQTVGSQVIAVLPPALAYGGSESELADETLVFVIDILAVG
ncbi:MAG: FKBP-type peptidyl-prolyl cis-trans isomerase [Naasia sp.]